MVKKIIFILIAVSLLAYLLIAVIYLNPKGKGETICNKVSVGIIDKQVNWSVKEIEIVRLLEKANIYPVGKKMAEIDTKKIEQLLEKNNLIKQAECYKTISGGIKITVRHRTPILMVFTAIRNYYIDTEGKILFVPANFSAYVPVATGNIDDEFAQKQLYEFVLFLQKNKFWNEQIEQIYVDANKEIELTPRVGNHQILLGKIENYPENLAKLKLFYDKGLNEVGWNKYSKIDLKYKNQVVCTKI